jgi:hypothetical protein
VVSVELGRENREMMQARKQAPKERKKERDDTHRVVVSVGVDRHSDSLVGKLHGEVLCTEAWSPEALGLDVGEGTDRSKGLGKFADFSEDGMNAGVNHVLRS